MRSDAINIIRSLNRLFMLSESFGVESNRGTEIIKMKQYSIEELASKIGVSKKNNR